MTVDLSGGLSADREYVFGEQPTEPEMRESVNAWIWDNNTEVGLPRIAVEAVANQWDTHDVQMNIAFADGRVYNVMGPRPVLDPLGTDGKPRVLGAGPISFELVEPFRHWKVRFDGRAKGGTVQGQIAGSFPLGAEGDTPVELEIDLVSAVPPWENGSLVPEAGRVLAEQDDGALMGGPRFEQLARATGVLRVGDSVHRIDGGALRVRSRGIRRLGTFRGHAWQSAVFPSGKGFGYIVYPPRDDGLPTYNEGYIFTGDGALVPAWVVDAPWLRRLRPSGEDVSVVIETANGTTRITAESVLSTFMVMGGVGRGERPILQQSISRYTWDGEFANGMMERSMPGDKVTVE